MISRVLMAYLSNQLSEIRDERLTKIIQSIPEKYTDALRTNQNRIMIMSLKKYQGDYVTRQWSWRKPRETDLRGHAAEVINHIRTNSFYCGVKPYIDRCHNSAEKREYAIWLKLSTK